MLSIRAAGSLKTADAAPPATRAQCGLMPGTKTRKSESSPLVKTRCQVKATRVIWGGGRRLLTEKIQGWRLNNFVSVGGAFLLHNNFIDSRMSSGQLPVPSYESVSIQWVEFMSNQWVDTSLWSLYSALHVHIPWEIEKRSQMGALSGSLWANGSGRRSNTLEHLDINTRVVAESGSRRYHHSTESALKSFRDGEGWNY